MPENLFVYGTLHPDRAPEEIADVVRKLKSLGTGTIRARMHRFEEYPAIKIDTRHGTRISGQVFRVPSEIALKQLDDYEEFYPAEPRRSLFRRVPVEVSLSNGSTLLCWVYEYNRRLPVSVNGLTPAEGQAARRRTA